MVAEMLTWWLGMVRLALSLWVEEEINGRVVAANLVPEAELSADLLKEVNEDR